MAANRQRTPEQEKLSQLKTGCQYPLLSEDPIIQMLFLMGRVTLEELNRIDPVKARSIHQLLGDISVRQRLIDGDWTLDDVNEANTFNQTRIISKLTTFCEKYNDDISWEIDATGIKTTLSSSENKRITEKRFSPALIDLLRIHQHGCCAGLTSMFLARAYLTATQTEDKPTESKNLEKDNLRTFYRDLKTIASWDGSSALTLEEQKLFRAFLYQMLQFQNTTESLYTSQNSLDQILLLSEQPDFPFVREEIYTMTVTQEQLREKLSFFDQPNRLTLISSGSHTIGRFNNLFFDSNCLAGDFQYHSEQYLALIIFQRLSFDNDTKPHLISITQFRHRLAPAAIYPPHKQMLENCSDPTVRAEQNQTGLLIASYRNDLKSLKIYLSKPNCDVNAVDNPGNNSLMIASLYGYVDITRTLLQEHKNCNINITNKNGQNALMLASSRDRTDIIRILLQEHKGFDVNAVNKIKNMNALMIAVNNGHLKTAQMLIAYGASLTLPWRFSPYPQQLVASLAEFKKQKELNLANPFIRRYIKADLLNANQASALSQEDREKLQNRTVELALTQRILTLEQVLKLTPLESKILNLASNTLTSLLPSDEKHETKPESAESYLQDTLIRLKTNLDQWTTQERKGEPDFIDRWLTNMYASLNVDIQNAELPVLCADLDRALTPLTKQNTEEVISVIKFLLENMPSSTSKTTSLSLFPSKDYYAELKAVINSKMTPNAKLNQIKKSLRFANEQNPNVELFTEIAAALSDFPYFKIFELKRKKEKAEANRLLRSK